MTMCPRCCKNTNGGYAHTCTPTNGWRELEKQRDALAQENKRLREALERIASPLPDEPWAHDIAADALATVKEKP